MKIAFCFLTQSDVFHPTIWEAFFADALSERSRVYCHPKYPALVKSHFLAGRVISERVPTRHGHISIVDATLALFAAAYCDDAENQYFILLSESTIPIVPFATICSDLARCESRSLIPFSVPPPGTEHHARLQTVANQAIFAKAFYLHDQWIVLHRRHVAALLDRSVLAQFARVFAADEHYIMNVLVHVKGVSLDQIGSRRTTFVNWREPEVKISPHPEIRGAIAQTVHPKTYHSLSASDLQEAGNAWFFRKVAASCARDLVLERIRSPVNV